MKFYRCTDFDTIKVYLKSLHQTFQQKILQSNHNQISMKSHIERKICAKLWKDQGSCVVLSVTKYQHVLPYVALLIGTIYLFKLLNVFSQITKCICVVVSATKFSMCCLMLPSGDKGGYVPPAHPTSRIQSQFQKSTKVRFWKTGQQIFKQWLAVQDMEEYVPSPLAVFPLVFFSNWIFRKRNQKQDKSNKWHSKVFSYNLS